jgi:hypothetical protein
MTQQAVQSATKNRLSLLSSNKPSREYREGFFYPAGEHGNRTHLSSSRQETTDVKGTKMKRLKILLSGIYLSNNRVFLIFVMYAGIGFYRRFSAHPGVKKKCNLKG